ncbi:MAG: TetR family transcriptional regulator [Deltaproteobacteria bacterium]|nr:MAG: TetR family transcriptional regulator [Deltaproteobacteria bacterium]
MAGASNRSRRRGRTRAERLSRADWAEAALTALLREGVSGINVQRLARGLKVARASFYWHFRDQDELLQEALALWERRATLDYIARLERIAEPRARLRTLVREAFAHAGAGRDFVALAAAVEQHPAVAEAMARALSARFAFLCRTYREIGLAAAEARHRAALANEAYVGLWQSRRVLPEGFEAGGRPVGLAAHLRFLERHLVP